MSDKELSFFEHIEELRQRLFKALLALIAGTVVSLIFTKDLIRVMTEPIGGPQALQSIEVTENISVYMRVSLLTGLILSMPVIVYQLLRFVIPGLTEQEQRYVLLAVPSASLLFLGGALFAYYVMLPVAVPFLIDFMSIPTVPRPANYIGFVTNMMLWIGLSFETPLLIFVLAKLEIVTAGMLVRYWRIAVVIIAVVAAVATPTVDPVNMGLLMLPLSLLYVLSIILAKLA